MDCKTLRKMTNDRYITLGAHCCCLKTWTDLKGDAHQPLVVYLLHRKQLNEVQKVSGILFGLKKRRGSLSFTFSLSHDFYLVSALLLENLSLFDKDSHGGRVIWPMCVPMGMVDRPTAPERHFSHFIFLLYHSQALT